MARAPLRVLFCCTGVGILNRGIEPFFGQTLRQYGNEFSAKRQDADLQPVIRHRYLRWLVTRTLHGRPPFVRLPQGRRVLPASRFNDFHAIATQHPEAPEFCVVDALLALTGEGAFFDVGANVGIMSVVASSTGRASRILAFEPSHRYCSAWHTNMALNGVENATLIQAAVGDRCDRIAFRVDPAMPLHGKIDMGVIYPTKQVQQVQMFTLDAICEITAIDRIALLKIDVEGAEPLVIRGAKDLLKSKRSNLYCLNS